MDEETVLVDEDFAEAVLSTLGAAYPRHFQPSKETRDIFVSRLIGLDAAALVQVVEAWIDEHPFPPSPAELRQPTLKVMRQAELLALVEESVVMRPRPGSSSAPGGDEVTTCGLPVGEVLMVTRQQFAHTFFGQVILTGFDPVGRTMRLTHPQRSALDWWNDMAIRGRILDTLRIVAQEPIKIEFV